MAHADRVSYGDRGGPPHQPPQHWQRAPLADRPDAGWLCFEFEERWNDAAGAFWYSREMIRATIRDGLIAEMSIYCTGDGINSARPSTQRE
jgi:hypothetical protein